MLAPCLATEKLGRKFCLQLLGITGLLFCKNNECKFVTVATVWLFYNNASVLTKLLNKAIFKYYSNLNYQPLPLNNLIIYNGNKNPFFFLLAMVHCSVCSRQIQQCDLISSDLLQVSSGHYLLSSVPTYVWLSILFNNFILQLHWQFSMLSDKNHASYQYLLGIIENLLNTILLIPFKVVFYFQ